MKKRFGHNLHNGLISTNIQQCIVWPKIGKSTGKTLNSNNIAQFICDIKINDL